MRQGNITLPVIYALEQPELRADLLAEIRRIQDGDGLGDARKAVDIIKKSEGIAKAEILADRYINKALNALDLLPDVKTKKTLRDIAHFVTRRSY